LLGVKTYSTDFGYKCKWFSLKKLVTQQGGFKPVESAARVNISGSTPKTGGSSNLMEVPLV